MSEGVVTIPTREMLSLAFVSILDSKMVPIRWEEVEMLSRSKKLWVSFRWEEDKSASI
jgi:hypothetical protein